MQISIVRAEESDIKSICTLYLSSRKTFLSYAPIPHTDEEVLNWFYTVVFPEMLLYKAVYNNYIAGMLVLKEGEEMNWIEQLYIEPKYVGKGIGSQLVQFAKKVLKRPIRLYTFQKNFKACRFYEREGFAVISSSDGSLNEERCPDILYEW